MPLWEREENQARGEKTKYQARHEEILDALTELSKASLLGIGANVDLARKKIVFEIKEGIDKTIQQHERPPVVFSDTRGNVDNRSYILNDADSRNCAYVAGQGEGAERTIVVVGDEYAGADRREVLIDARDVEDAAELPERGKTKLADMLPAESYTTDVEVDGYEDKWFLGDFVTVFDEEYGVTLMEQVLEVEEDMDENGYIVTPTFGIPEKTISEKISFSGSGGGGSSSVGSGKDKHYTHIQNTASAEWNITHGLGKFPAVTVVDSAGSEVIGDVEHISINTTKLTFMSAFSGKAHFN
jgi:hypothetical protein